MKPQSYTKSMLTAHLLMGSVRTMAALSSSPLSNAAHHLKPIPQSGHHTLSEPACMRHITKLDNPIAFINNRFSMNRLSVQSRPGNGHTTNHVRYFHHHAPLHKKTALGFGLSCDPEGIEGLEFRKKNKKDAFVEHFKLGAKNDVRHIIPLFLFREALLKAHLCHGDDAKLLQFYEKILTQCGTNFDKNSTMSLKQKFYAQLAKCRFNVFIGNSKDNSLMGTYGYILHSTCEKVKDYLDQMDRGDRAQDPEAQKCERIARYKMHLLSQLKIQGKKDALSLSLIQLIHSEFEDLIQSHALNPTVSWPDLKSSLIKTMHRIRDTMVFDRPQSNHEGIRNTQLKHLIPAYAALQSFVSKETASIDLFIQAVELLYTNEKACLSFFPNKQWEDLYPTASEVGIAKNETEAFARTVGQTLRVNI